MARKVVMHKRNGGGLEAPRNSMEIPIETSYGLYSARDNILYAHHTTKEDDYYSTEAPTKKLISEDIPGRPSTRSNSPSVVARLMGVDVLPFDSKNGIPMRKLIDETRPRKGSIGHYIDGYPDQYSSRTNLNKHKPREHPQEEELQKFKKEFEAWQATRFNECSNTVKFISPPPELIAQAELNRKKMHLYGSSNRITRSESSREYNDISELNNRHEMLAYDRVTRTDFGASHLISSSQKHDIVSPPSKIVILRPGRENMIMNEDLWSNTPSTSGEIDTVEDFLKDVKERLNSELLGKCSKRSTTVRGGGIETPYREKPSKPREIAQSIAQEVRDSVLRDLGMNLLRSESTRSYRSEFQNAKSSPEFVNRDTRKFLAERLGNVLRGEKRREFPSVVNNSSIISQADMSPRNLARSLSAPLSGTSFGKLLLEDRHMLTGVQIRRKHEATEKVSINIKKQKKDKFNIREKVSSFRYSLTLRGRLFRRRVKSMEVVGQNKNNLLKDNPNGQSVMMSFFDTHGNSTEVPPSPASARSSVHDEFWRSSDYLSPISSQLEDSDMSYVFGEINSNLSELRRKLDQLEGACLGDTISESQCSEVYADIEDPSEAYIRDLLITSGLYDGSFSHSLSNWNPLGKPISTQVFEQVEETYKESTKDKDQGEKINHKILVDLLNEVLPAILREPVTISRYMEKAIGLVHNPPNGRNLLSLVWNRIHVYVYPTLDRSLDYMLARDLKSNPWSGLVDDDVNTVGRDIECLIIGDMIEEMVKDIYS